MKKTILAIFTTMLFSYSNFAQEVDSTQIQIDEIEKSLTYQTGVIELESGNATLRVPNGFRFLDRKQSFYVLTELWGNPADSTILGMLVPENKGVLEANTWVFTIGFEEIGYVKDDDADDIDYDELLTEQKKEFKEANPERIKLGYEPMEFVGWASAPYYDKNKKILHWAKELKFGQDSINTLNYNLRVLGRKGIFVLNAVSSMNELPEVKSNIEKVIASVEFKDGHKYSDFNEDEDNVAEWTIGGLIAGKILAKVGFFALIAKFGKFIVLAVIGAASVLWKFIKNRKTKEEIQPTAEDSE